MTDAMPTRAHRSQALPFIIAMVVMSSAMLPFVARREVVYYHILSLAISGAMQGQKSLIFAKIM
jgi:hypothetical protein